MRTGSGIVIAEARRQGDVGDFISNVNFEAIGDLLVGIGPDEFAVFPGGSDGQVLTFDSTKPTGVKWAAPTGGPGGGSTDLDGLLDVSVTAPVVNQILRYNGTHWVNVVQSTTGVDATLANAKGDLYGASADNTPVRVPAAAAADYLMVSDPAQASGVGWKQYLAKFGMGIAPTATTLFNVSHTYNQTLNAAVRPFAFNDVRTFTVNQTSTASGDGPASIGFHHNVKVNAGITVDYDCVVIGGVLMGPTRAWDAAQSTAQVRHYGGYASHFDTDLSSDLHVGFSAHLGFLGGINEISELMVGFDISAMNQLPPDFVPGHEGTILKAVGFRLDPNAASLSAEETWGVAIGAGIPSHFLGGLMVGDPGDGILMGTLPGVPLQVNGSTLLLGVMTITGTVFMGNGLDITGQLNVEGRMVHDHVALNEPYKTTISAAGVLYEFLQGVTTTNTATPTNILAWVAPNDDDTFMWTAEIVAQQTAGTGTVGHSATYRMSWIVKAGGASSLQGARDVVVGTGGPPITAVTTTNHKDLVEDDATWDVTAAAFFTANTVSVTGHATKTIKWTAYIRVLRVA